MQKTFGPYFQLLELPEVRNVLLKKVSIAVNSFKIFSKSLILSSFSVII